MSLIERSELLPRARYHSTTVPDGRLERDAWRDDLLSKASGIDLVFLDPDNGIEVPSKPVGRKRSSKYIAWMEIQALWEAGCSLLIYQHFRREARDAFVHRLGSELRERTGASFVEAFLTSHVLFLLVTQDRHQERLGLAFDVLSSRWKGQFDRLELANKLLLPTGFASG